MRRADMDVTQCNGEHHGGCLCHEARWIAKVAELNAEVERLTNERDEWMRLCEVARDEWASLRADVEETILELVRERDALRAEVERLKEAAGKARIGLALENAALRARLAALEEEFRALKVDHLELQEAANVALAYVVTPVSIDKRELERKLRKALGEGK